MEGSDIMEGSDVRRWRGVNATGLFLGDLWHLGKRCNQLTVSAVEMIRDNIDEALRISDKVDYAGWEWLVMSYGKPLEFSEEIRMVWILVDGVHRMLRVWDLDVFEDRMSFDEDRWVWEAGGRSRRLP